MTTPTASAPFRWNLAKREQLPRAIRQDQSPSDAPGVRHPTHPPPHFQKDLRSCAARVLALCGNADLYFVGRSPESLYDHLHGLLLDSSWRSRIHLLPFSCYGSPPSGLTRACSPVASRLRAHLTNAGLDPRSLATRDHPVALVDLVCSGGTLGNLLRAIHAWSHDARADWNVIRRRIRIIGITRREAPSPRTWRWWQHAPWTGLLPHGAVKNVSTHHGLWSYLGNYQPKLTDSYTPDQWGHHLGPDQTRVDGLRIALHLFDSGCDPERRRSFARLLVQDRAVCHAWFRAIALELAHG